MRKSLAVLSLSLGLVLLSLVAFSPAKADPTLPDIVPHHHYVQLQNGTLVEVGPRVCENPELQPAFNQFHYNIHHALPLEGTNGPQNGAPGLHNFKGADLTGQLC
jgi:hypothetical protein